MKKMFKVLVLAAVCAGAWSVGNAAETETVRGMGYVRGRKRVILRNKFAGFVTKVHVYSQTKVKPGDVIIEYDDLDARTAVAKLENSDAE